MTIMAKIIHIVLLGEIHRDPASAYLVRQLLSSAQERQQPVIFADEDTITSTIDHKRQGNQEFIEINNRLIKQFSLESLLSHDLTRPYFQLSCRQEIIERLMQWYSKEMAQSATDGLMRHACWSELISLWEFLEKKNIPNCPFDADERSRVIARKNYTDFFGQEAFRIEQMTINLMTAIKNYLPQGGMIVVLGGVNHTPNLLAALKAYWQENKQPDYELILQAARLFSPYVLDGLPPHQKYISHLRQVLSAKIGTFYNLEATPVEKISENAQDGTFNSMLLERLSKNFYTTYQIANYNAQKRQQIRDLFGHIVSETSDGYLTALIHSAYLVAPIRKQLGLERYRLSFKNHINERLIYLKENCPNLTIESESEHTVMVTFSESTETKMHLNLVTDDKQWQVYQTNLMSTYMP
jgi:hypothetical protein